ncbi:MAG: winged helix-turn-helix domain-containing protein [Clostridium sp.]
MGHSTGAPRKLKKKHEELLIETIVNKTPEDVGFNARKSWTIEIIRQWIYTTFNVLMSHRGTAEILYRLNLSYTRPTYVLKKLIL